MPRLRFTLNLCDAWRKYLQEIFKVSWLDRRWSLFVLLFLVWVVFVLLVFCGFGAFVVSLMVAGNL